MIHLRPRISRVHAHRGPPGAGDSAGHGRNHPGGDIHFHDTCLYLGNSPSSYLTMSLHAVLLLPRPRSHVQVLRLGYDIRCRATYT